MVSFLRAFPQNPSKHLYSLPHVQDVTPIPSSDLIILIKFGEKHRSRSALYNSLQPPVISSLSTNIFLRVLLSKTLRLCSSSNMSDHVSHP